MVVPQEFRHWKFRGYFRTEPSTTVFMDLPSSSHWAKVNGFMVEPGWAPPRPFRSLPFSSNLSTLKLSWESNFPLAGSHDVFWAMLVILPVPGSTETRAAPHLSGFAPAAASTCAWAAFWAAGSSVVLIVRPPRKTFRSRSFASAPYAGLLSSRCST